MEFKAVQSGRQGGGARGTQSMQTDKTILQDQSIDSGCSWIVYVLLKALALALLGCSTAVGPRFTQATDVGPDQAIIYVYRPSGFGARALTWQVTANDDELGTIANGTFVSFVTDPGQVELHVHSQRTERWGTALSGVGLLSGFGFPIPEAPPSQLHFTIDAKPGEVYYLRCEAWRGEPEIEPVAATRGSTEIVKTRRYEDAWTLKMTNANKAHRDGRHELAESRYRHALNLSEQARHPCAARGTTRNNLAVLYTRQARYPEAEAQYDVAVETWEQCGEELALAETLESYAAMLREVGRVDKAVSLEKRAAEVRD
jgi:hypothetical protein